mgnify:CR=1 FL=1
MRARGRNDRYERVSKINQYFHLCNYFYKTKLIHMCQADTYVMGRTVNRVQEGGIEYLEKL